MAKKSSKGRGKKPPLPKLTIRRNGAPIEVMRNAAPIVPVRAASMRRNSADGQKPARKEKTRKPMKKRLQSMGASHVIAGGAAFAASAVLNVLMVGQGWMKPTTAAGTLISAGAVTTGTGWATESDHVMCSGVGLTAAGTFALVQHYAIDANEAITRKRDEKKKQASEKQADDHEQDRAETGKASKPPAERRNGGSYIRLVREHETI